MEKVGTYALLRSEWEFSGLYLVSCEDTEGVDDLFFCVDVCGFSGHEVEEAVELDEAAAVGVDDGHDSLEVNFALEKIDASVKLARFGRKRCSLILA